MIAQNSPSKAVVEPRGGGLAVIIFVILGLTLGALGHVAVHAKRLEVALALGNEERIHRELEEQRRHLEIEIAMLKEPGEVSRRARENLHMAPPTPEDIKPLGKPRKAAP